MALINDTNVKLLPFYAIIQSLGSFEE